MRNFAEEIAYLYFRLNGFFLLDNYVTHAGENNNRYHADSDLLGIKTNMVYEEIGLRNESDIDQNIFKMIENYQYIGLICEIKGGGRVELDNAEYRIKPCVHRMGIVDSSQMDAAISKLSTQQFYQDSNTKIIKVVATNNELSDCLAKLWYRISLDTMISFIESRAEKYPQKGIGWNFYSSNLFQYLLKKNRL